MKTGAVHVHLDPLGGVSGDMFLAAAVDLRPALAETIVEAVRDGGLPPAAAPAFAAADLHGLKGRRFTLGGALPPRPDRRYDQIRSALQASRLGSAVKARALGIYELLATAEASVHGVAVEDVSFHELAEWDTLADVVGAAAAIEALGASGWSVAPLPLGGGTVRTAHGVLPVPAPATVKLLEGLPVRDDGITGERVTPTGAAILRHLAPATAMPARPHRMFGQGFGFGTRETPGQPNGLRLLALVAVPDESAAAGSGEEVVVLAFEVDDQTPEDLALGLDALRAVDGVLDVTQSPVFGKKNRMGARVQVTCRPDARERAAAACFDETTTIGLRWQRVRRIVLERTVRPGAPRVKLVTRPRRGRTAKAEASDLPAVADGHEGRSTAARLAEQDALAEERDER